MYLQRAGRPTIILPAVHSPYPLCRSPLATHLVARSHPASPHIWERLPLTPPNSSNRRYHGIHGPVASRSSLALCFSSAKSVTVALNRVARNARSFAATDIPSQQSLHHSTAARCIHQRTVVGILSPTSLNDIQLSHLAPERITVARFTTAADKDAPIAATASVVSSSPSSHRPASPAPSDEYVAASASSSIAPLAAPTTPTAGSSTPSSQLAAADYQLLAAALAPSVPSAAPKPTASPPPLSSDSSPLPPAALLSVPFAPMPTPAASALPSAPDPLEAFASQQSDQPTVDSTKDPTAPLSIPAMPDLPPKTGQTSSAPSAVNSIETAPNSSDERFRSTASSRPHDAAAAPGATSSTAQSDSSTTSPYSGLQFSSSSHSPQSPLSDPSPSAPFVNVSTTSSSSPQPSSAGGVSSSSVTVDPSSASALTSVPSFLRPAELSLWSRIKLHPLFKHWPNIGYLISAVSVLVSDILWLRSLLICANCFGILVNRSFNFWTGIYWNIFFILANLLQIVLILIDRRQVQLSEEEQRLYELVFADVFSPQEFKKLRKAGEMEDRPAGSQLMTQGAEIDLVYLIVDGLVVVEEEKKVAVHKSVSAPDSGSGVASAVSGLVSSSSPSLLSYVFGSAGDDRAHGLSADHTSSAEDGGTDSTDAHSTSASSLEDFQPASGLAHAVREVAQMGAHVLDHLTGLHQPAQHVESIRTEPTEAEQQHLYQQLHAQNGQPTNEQQRQASTVTATAVTTATAVSGPALASASSIKLPNEPSTVPSLPLSSLASAFALTAPLSSASSDGSLSSDPSHPASTADDRDRRRSDRRAKREKKRRDKQSGGLASQLGGTGLPSTLVSVSADGTYEIRRETLGYMRSGRLVGEMSLLTSTAPTNVSTKSQFEPTSAEVKVNASDAATAPTAAVYPSSSPGPSSSSLLASLPSPSELLSPTLSSSAATVATATVTCLEPCRVLVWRRDALRSLFFRFPSLSVGWHATVSSDLIARLGEARRLSLHNGYKLLLLGICAEGSVTIKQRSAADEYRRLNGISEDDHQRTLADLGWTGGEWDRGTKKQSWMEAIRAGLPAARRASL